MENKWVLVTGATSGIGKALTEALALEGCHLVICGRRSERLQKIKETLEKKYSIKVVPLSFDI